MLFTLERQVIVRESLNTASLTIPLSLNLRLSNDYLRHDFMSVKFEYSEISNSPVGKMNYWCSETVPNILQHSHRCVTDETYWPYKAAIWFCNGELIIIHSEHYLWVSSNYDSTIKPIILTNSAKKYLTSTSMNSNHVQFNLVKNMCQLRRKTSYHFNKGTRSKGTTYMLCKLIHIVSSEEHL